MVHLGNDLILINYFLAEILRRAKHIRIASKIQMIQKCPHLLSIH